MEHNKIVRVTSETNKESNETLWRLGERVNSYRRQKGLTLIDLAALSDVSVSFLSQLERGIGNPSFLTLTKIAKGLSMPAGSLFGEETGPLSDIVRKNKRRRLIYDNSDLIYELITPDLSRSFEVIWVEIAPGAIEPNSPFRHEGEECILVIEGRISFTLDEVVQILDSGDSITFNGQIPHSAANLDEKLAKILSIIGPPAF